MSASESPTFQTSDSVSIVEAVAKALREAAGDKWTMLAWPPMARVALVVAEPLLMAEHRRCVEDEHQRWLRSTHARAALASEVIWWRSQRNELVDHLRNARSALASIAADPPPSGSAWQVASAAIHRIDAALVEITEEHK